MFKWPLHSINLYHCSLVSHICMYQWTGSALVVVMARHVFCAEPYPEAMLNYCYLDSEEQMSMKFTLKCNIFSCYQAALWMVKSVRLSVCHSICPFFCPLHIFTMFPSSYHHEISRNYYHWQKWCPCKKVKVRGQRSKSQRSKPNLAISGL